MKTTNYPSSNSSITAMPLFINILIVKCCRWQKNPSPLVLTIAMVYEKVCTFVSKDGKLFAKI